MYDILITGGRVIDGTGSPWYRADIAIMDNRIVAVGKLADSSAHHTIDADDRVVCPGFIDMHTHSDLQPLAHPLQECKIRQGVTTELIGHDGLGLAPITPQTAAILQEQLAGWNGRPDVAWDWHTATMYLDRFEETTAVNVAWLVPHGTVRMLVMGEDNRAPTDDEMQAMCHIITQCMREGAVGLSTGLTYSPCMFATDDEMVTLCETLQPFNGFYCPHHRNYGSEALKAYADSIEIARRANVPVHLTHCHLGYPNNKGRAPELLANIDAARADGVEVTMDTYPYLAGSTYLHAFLPSWMHDGGSEAILARLQSTDLHDRLRHDMEVVGSDGFNGIPMGWEMIQISGIMDGEADPSLVGMYLPEAAARAGKSPFEFFVELLLQSRLSVSCLAHIGNEENVQTILQHPAHTVGSDGILVGERPHPRGWGTHVKFLAHYVRDMGLLSWEEGIRKMTSAAARRIGAIDRGIIRPGMMADIVVFDADTLRDTATYDNPRSYPEGVHHVIVNGIPVVAGAQVTGATPGRPLRSPYGRQPERMTTLVY
ncbi:MAG: D-aminoacylase [Chloroflexi bacterium]|nr:MAG: D-aminoacylase [Chloroflexota bacterium]